MFTPPAVFPKWDTASTALLINRVQPSVPASFAGTDLRTGPSGTAMPDYTKGGQPRQPEPSPRENNVERGRGGSHPRNPEASRRSPWSSVSGRASSGAVGEAVSGALAEAVCYAAQYALADAPSNVSEFTLSEASVAALPGAFGQAFSASWVPDSRLGIAGRCRWLQADYRLPTVSGLNCRGPESNRHDPYPGQGILSPWRLPIPPPRQTILDSRL